MRVDLVQLRITQFETGRDVIERIDVLINEVAQLFLARADADDVVHRVIGYFRM